MKQIIGPSLASFSIPSLQSWTLGLEEPSYPHTAPCLAQCILPGMEAPPCLLSTYTCRLPITWHLASPRNHTCPFPSVHLGLIPQGTWTLQYPETLVSSPHHRPSSLCPGHWPPRRPGSLIQMLHPLCIL